MVNWERIKSEEKGGEHPIDDEIPVTLPALARAAKVQRRAAGRGFDWRSREAALDKIREELGELEAELRLIGENASPAAPASDRVDEELGDLLFAVAAAGRWAGADPEAALRKATRRFSLRFERMKTRAEAEGLRLEDLSEDDLTARFRAAADS
jgi:ATP diphosphatase